MKAVLCSLTLAAAAATGFVRADQFDGVRALAGRVSADLVGKVTFAELSGVTGEQAKIVPGESSIVIQATSARMASFALGQYIRTIAKGHISWCGNQIPTTWPTTGFAETTVKPLHPYAIAYNYCTLSYTMAFWGEDAWQAEIDRLALQGYNVALVTAGLQKVWKLTLTDMGYSEDQIRKFIADDAVAAWWHMGNLQAWGNVNKPDVAYPVTDAQIDLDGAYGASLVAKMRAVGIEPIIQSFIGLIPSTTTEAQLEALDGVGAGNARIFRNGDYVDTQKNPDLLDPTSKAFAVFSAAWNKNLKAVYGFGETTPMPKYLGGDLFHESAPPAGMTAEEGRNCAVNIQKFQKEAFGADVVWILQSWQGSPAQVIRNGLDPNNTLIQFLDQSMQNTGAIGYECWNQTDNKQLPWVWCEVMNFGGNTGMHGAFRRFKTIGNISSSAYFKGYGLLSEGLETNPSSYEMFADGVTAPTVEKQNVGDEAAWLASYRKRRYGLGDEDIEDLGKAHEICARTVWDCKSGVQGTLESVFCALPAWNVGAVSSWGPGGSIAYDREELVRAARDYLAAAKAAPALLEKNTFRYDFVEIFQQILADKAREMLPTCATDKARRDQFRKMIDLLDRILACSADWRLDAKEARLTKVAPGTDAVAAYRRMITTWVPGSWGVHTSLGEYAHRSYAGLIKHYYGARWEKFLDVADGVASAGDYDAYVNALAVGFPTMDLTGANATPALATVDPIAVAEEILGTIQPRVMTWTGAAGDGVWSGANWSSNAAEGAVDWEDGANVVFADMNGASIAMDAAVTIGDLELRGRSASETANTYTGDFIGLFADDEKGVDLGWTGVTVAELAASEFSAGMGGSWLNSDPSGYGYRVTKVDDARVDVQIQTLDDAHVKFVCLRLTVANGVVYAKHLWSGNTSDVARLGEDFSRDDPWTGDACKDGGTLKYGVKGLTRYHPSSLALTGAAPTFTGKVTLSRGNELSLPNGTVVPTLAFKGDTATLNLGAGACRITINDLVIPADAKLVVKGAASELWNAADDAQGVFFKTADGEVSKPKGTLVYVCTTAGDPKFGVEQPLAVDGATGAAKRVLSTLAMPADVWIPKTGVKTGWKNVALDDLCKMQYTAKMDGGYVNPFNENVSAWDARGYVVTRDESAVYVQMQIFDGGYLKSVNLELTIDRDNEVFVKALKICNRDDAGNNTLGTDTTHLSNSSDWGPPDVVTDVNGNGYGVFALTATPAAWKVADTGSNYADFAAAREAANATVSKGLSAIADWTIDAVLTDGIRLTIEPNVTVTSGKNEALSEGGGADVVVKGTLDLADHRWVFADGSELEVHAGGRILGRGQVYNGTNVGAVDMTGSAHVLKAVKSGDAPAAVIRAPLRVRSNVTLDVAAETTLELADVTQDAYCPEADRTIVKTGAGDLVISGFVHDRFTFATGEGAGVLKRALSAGETFKVSGATAANTAIASKDPDFKVASATADGVTTYSLVACVWIANVTETPGARSEDPGTLFEDVAAAQAYVLSVLPANPDARLWLLGALKESQATFPGWETVGGPPGVECWKIAATVGETPYRSFEAAIAAANGAPIVVVDDVNFKTPAGWEKEGDILRRVVYWIKNAEGHWTPDRLMNVDRDGSATTPYQTGDRVVFPDNVTIYADHSFAQPLYLTVETGVTLTAGHESAGGNKNLPSGTVVTLEAGALLDFIYWGGGGGSASLDDLTVDGEGCFFGYDKARSGALTAGNLTGTATLFIEDGETVTADAVANPVRLVGSGCLKLNSETATAKVSSDKWWLNVVRTVEGGQAVYRLKKSGMAVVFR